MSYSPVAAQHARPDYDRTLLWLVLLLLGFGLVMVYSSSIAIAAASKHTGFQESYYLVRQGGLSSASAPCLGLFAFQVPNKVLAGNCALSVPGRHGAAGAGADSRHRPRGQRQPALAVAGRDQSAAVRVHEAVRGAVCRRLHGAQGGATWTTSRRASCRCSW